MVKYSGLQDTFQWYTDFLFIFLNIGNLPSIHLSGVTQKISFPIQVQVAEKIEFLIGICVTHRKDLNAMSLPHPTYPKS